MGSTVAPVPDKQTLASVTELLHLAFLVYRRSAGIFIGYSAWLLLPIAASYLILVLTPEGIVGSILIVLINIGLFILSIWVSIALIVVTAALLTHRTISSDLVALAAKKRFGDTVFVCLLTNIIKLVGFILLIVPGIIVSVWYAFAQIEVVLNDKRSLEALSTSRDLSRGRFWPVAWRLFVGPLMLVGLYLIFVDVLERVLTFLGVQQIGIELLSSTVSVLYLPIILIYSVTLYMELKRTRENH